MTRPIITTPYSERSIVTSDYTTRQGLDYLIQEALGKLLLESGDGAILLERSINSLYTSRSETTTIYS